MTSVGERALSGAQPLSYDVGMRVVVAAMLGLLVTPALADTLGLPPCTKPVAEWRLARAASGAPKVVAARDAAEWARVWASVGGRGAAPTVDFTRYTVVGVTTTEKEGLVIYRVQIDDASRPRALEVRVAERAAFCDYKDGPPGAAVHLLVTPRTALPIHFVVDRMIDGGLFGWNNEGTEARPLGTIPAGTVALPVPVVLREDAERRARAAMTPEEVERLSRGPTGGRMKRFPHPWVRLEVERREDRWRVDYEALRFEVDVARGTVARRR
jgi:hypothetical protein